MAKVDPKLGGVRKEIDALDDKLFALLQKRAALANKAGDIKRAQGVTEYARIEREIEVRQRAIAARGVLSKESMDAIYREIISGCLALEKPQNICYLGPEYTFTHEAAKKHFGDAAEYKSAATIREAVSMTEKEVCNFTIVPFENSNGGTVGETFDVLTDTSLEICGEIILRIRHNLLTKNELSPKIIKTIYAHPQAFEQCQEWLIHNVPEAKLVPLGSNAAAAQMVMERGDIGNEYPAAIASMSAAEHYKLKALAKDIEDSAFNTTRFLMLGRTIPRPSGNDKTSLIMTAHHESGALYHLLEPFSRLGINMSKFESRPARGKLGEYLFFVDIDGHKEDKKVVEALNEIHQCAALLKVFGSYPKAVE